MGSSSHTGTDRLFERVQRTRSHPLSSNSSSPKNQDKDRLWSVIVHVAKSYCEITVLHGVKYLGEPRRKLWERVVWAVILCGFISVGIYLLWVATNDSLTKPVIINLDSSNHPIWNFPFPAVTICPLNKLNKTLAKKWIATLSLPNNLSKGDLLALLPNVLRLVDPANSTDLDILQDVADSNNVSIHSVYEMISVQCEHLLVSCKLQNHHVDCKHLFRTVRTSEGYCCSYNYFGLRSIFNLQVYHVPSKETPTQPVRLSTSGRDGGLSVIIRTSEEDNLGTLMSSTGAKILFHKSLNYPDNLEIEKLVESGQSVSYAITPELINATSEVRDVPLNHRDCYFFDEMELHSVQIYSYKNCIFNCRLDTYLRLCGCVPFIYPTQEKFRVCDLRDNDCLVKNRHALQTLRSNTTPDVSADESAPCACRPQCNDVTYSISTSSATMVQDSHLFVDEFQDVMLQNTAQHTEITIFMFSQFATKYQRLVYHSNYKLLAGFGGLLGLFMGFSFISALEVVYSCTVRVLFQLYMTRPLPQPSPQPGPAPFVLLGTYRRHS